MRSRNLLLSLYFPDASNSPHLQLLRLTTLTSQSISFSSTALDRSRLCTHRRIQSPRHHNVNNEIHISLCGSVPSTPPHSSFFHASAFHASACWTHTYVSRLRISHLACPVRLLDCTYLCFYAEFCRRATDNSLEQFADVRFGRTTTSYFTPTSGAIPPLPLSTLPLRPGVLAPSSTISSTAWPSLPTQICTARHRLRDAFVTRTDSSAILWRHLWHSLRSTMHATTQDVTTTIRPKIHWEYRLRGLGEMLARCIKLYLGNAATCSKRKCGDVIQDSDRQSKRLRYRDWLMSCR